jgi:uncharacterized protein YfeS
VNTPSVKKLISQVELASALMSLAQEQLRELHQLQSVTMNQKMKLELNQSPQLKVLMEQLSLMQSLLRPILLTAQTRSQLLLSLLERLLLVKESTKILVTAMM